MPTEKCFAKILVGFSQQQKVVKRSSISSTYVFVGKEFKTMR